MSYKFFYQHKCVPFIEITAGIRVRIKMIQIRFKGGLTVMNFLSNCNKPKWNIFCSETYRQSDCSYHSYQYVNIVKI